MIVTVISFILLAVCFLGTAYIAVSLHRDPPIVTEASWLTKNDMGQYEERLSDLREVILRADEIDIPTHDNARDILFALLDNFSEEVIYNFIVPESYEKSNGEEIRRRYYAIIDLAGQLSERELSHSLFRLHSRPIKGKQKDFPYIFYRFASPDTDTEIVAFRGEDEGAGIADNYRRLEPELARSLLFSVLPYMTSSEQPIRSEDYAAFVPEGKIIKLKPINRGLRKNGRTKPISRSCG